MIPTLTFEQWSRDLLSLPPESRTKFIYDSLRSKDVLHIFGKWFFPHIIQGPDEVPELHIGLIRELTSPKDSAIVFPRGFAKSTWEKIDTLHDVVYGLEPVVLYISNTVTDAQQHFESIKIELENNTALREVYGDLVPSDAELSKKWTNKHLQTVNGVNLVARGRGKGRGVNIKNKRPTKIICDDIEDDELVKSQDQRLKLNSWLTRVIFPALDPERGRIKIIGTILSVDCELMKFYQQHGGIFRKAIEDGKSIWPEMWPLERLEEKRRKIGSRAFSQEYLNTPTSDETAIIKYSWMENTFFTVLPTSIHPIRKVIMFDPQAGESENADYFGLAVLAYYANDINRYFIHIQSGRATQIEQAALVVRTYQKHKEAHIVGVEKVLNQVAVYQLILDWKAGKIELPDVDNTNRNIPLVAVQPEGKDKVARLQMHQPAFERSEVHFLPGMQGFCEKLACFPAVSHDDDIDAVTYCLEYANRSTLKLRVNIFDDPLESIDVPQNVFAGIRNKKF